MGTVASDEPRLHPFEVALRGELTVHLRVDVTRAGGFESSADCFHYPLSFHLQVYPVPRAVMLSLSKCFLLLR